MVLEYVASDVQGKLLELLVGRGVGRRLQLEALLGDVMENRLERREDDDDIGSLDLRVLVQHGDEVPAAAALFQELDQDFIAGGVLQKRKPIRVRPM